MRGDHAPMEGHERDPQKRITFEQENRYTIREQAIAVTRRAEAHRKSALSTELPVHDAPGGIRTRDLSRCRRSNSDLHHGSCKGLAGNGRCCCRSEEQPELRHFCRRASNPRPPTPQWAGALTEVTGIFTTALPPLLATAIGRGALGNGRCRRSMTSTQSLSLRKDPALGRVQTLVRSHPGAYVKGWIRTIISRSIRNLHHQRRLSREGCGKPD